jgi:lipopolysaccharide export system permease protein
LQRVFESALSSARNVRERISSIAYDHEYRARKIRKHEVELHRKFTLSFACLILFFIGAPLGAIIRKGGLGMPLVMSVLMFVVYHISSMMGEKFAKELVIPAWQGMWLASALFLPLGVFLTIKATTDAPLLDADGYRKRIERLLAWFSRKKHSLK